ncbi:PX domain-containing protein kinase-like protein isoform X2 [Tachypleus tridentatus]|uniref:PX domain-containing protein kinase-like protein isoform X2 n=1 Tax=Tachypleus tridentatus TaxID=6853 RepID=UPI003FD3EC6A
MAMFESRMSVRVVLDDTQQLTCIIEAAENVQGHTAYILRIQRGLAGDNFWHLSRRYSDFVTLNTQLQSASIDLTLPPKKVFGNMGREFIAERQQGLQAYINAVLENPMLANSLAVKQFLDPDQYSCNFVETALQHVSMAFRSESRWEVVEPLPEMGWRLRKQYFLIKPKGESKERQVLSWVPLGPDHYLEDKDLQSAIKLLTGLQHPFIYPITFASVRESGGLFIRNFEENGSLRDLICKCKPRNSFLKKYISPKSVTPVPQHLIKKFGQQILVALKFLQDKGIPHGHLHSGNIIIEKEMCRLLEVENQLLGLPAYLRPQFIQLRKVQTLQNVDTYSFGHLVYEMTFGSPCLRPTCNSFPPECPAELRSILEATISTEACKNGLPSVSHLLMHPFFANMSNVGQEKVHLKVPSQLKENLQKAKEQVEARIREEQKSFRHSQRLSKVHAQFTSEEEIKKRINERKKQQKLTTTTTVPSTTTTTVQNGASTASPLTSEKSSTLPTIPPPPPPPPPPPSQLLISPPNSVNGNGVPLPNLSPPPPSDRKMLLGSIEAFNKGKLKKTATKDCSSPRF